MLAARRYKQTAQTTASPERLLVLLLHAAIKNMRLAADGYEGQAGPEADDAIDKAHEIVLYLQETLDPSAAPELAENLTATYTFVCLHLTRAMMARDPVKVREAERVLMPVVEAFDQAVSQLGKNT